MDKAPGHLIVIFFNLTGTGGYYFCHILFGIEKGAYKNYAIGIHQGHF